MFSDAGAIEVVSDLPVDPSCLVFEVLEFGYWMFDYDLEGREADAGRNIYLVAEGRVTFTLLIMLYPVQYFFNSERTDQFVIS